MQTYNVMQEWEVTDQESVYFGSHAIGTVIEVDEETALPLVDQGILELVVAPEPAADPTPAPAGTPGTPTGVKYFYHDLEIITDIEEVEMHGLPFKTFQTSDFSTYKLSPEEFRANVRTEEIME